MARKARVIRREGKKHVIGNIGMATVALMPAVSNLSGILALKAGMAVAPAAMISRVLAIVMFVVAISLGIYGTLKERSWTSHGTLVIATLYLSQYLAALVSLL